MVVVLLPLPGRPGHGRAIVAGHDGETDVVESLQEAGEPVADAFGQVVELSRIAWIVGSACDLVDHLIVVRSDGVERSPAF